MGEQRWESKKTSPFKGGSLVVVAGHAVYANKAWHGGYPGEEQFYESHIREGFHLLEESYDAIVLSGGRTRPHLRINTISEADGMLTFAREHALDSITSKPILLEPWARDSAENLMFSLLAFFRHFQQWPERLGVVSWTSKALRCQIISCGLRLEGRFSFHGVGDYPKEYLGRACAAEARMIAAMVNLKLAPPNFALKDPVLRNRAVFASKRWKRMPEEFDANQTGNRRYLEEVSRHYEVGSGTVSALLEQVDRLRPGSSWESVRWPWQVDQGF